MIERCCAFCAATLRALAVAETHLPMPLDCALMCHSSLNAAVPRAAFCALQTLAALTLVGFGAAGVRNVWSFSCTFRTSTVCSLSASAQLPSTTRLIDWIGCEPTSATAAAHVEHCV